MPPEAFSNSAQKGSRRPRDIWSFGVLMCVVFHPDFLVNIVRKHPDGVHGPTATGQFAREVAERVRAIAWTGSLRDLAVSCLSLDPKPRPRIGDVLYVLAKRDAGKGTRKAKSSRRSNVEGTGTKFKRRIAGPIPLVVGIILLAVYSNVFDCYIAPLFVYGAVCVEESLFAS